MLQSDQVTRFTIQPIAETMRSEVAEMLITVWGSDRMVSRGKLWYPGELPGYFAIVDGKPAGLITYHIDNHQCEVVTLNSRIERCGIGSALLAAVQEAAREAGCERLWLITTNDNLPALRFYQKRGFRLASLYPNALEVSRKIKPEIPLTGLDGISLRDEIELEMPLDSII